MHIRVDWHGNFAKALLHPEEAVPPGLQDPYGKPTLKRFSVYRNNIMAGLTEALKVDFPAVCRIVGEDFFAAMARVYVVQQPPRSPLLLEYGEHFPAFIDNFNPVKSLPYVGDVARIERAWLEAYHAPEATPLQSPALASISSKQLRDIRFHLHPSVRLIRSRYPAFTIWSTNIEGGTPTAVNLECNEHVLVSRPAAEVEIRQLSTGGAEFLCSIAEGNMVGESAWTALASDCNFDLSKTLTGSIEAGAFVAYQSQSATITSYARGRCAG